MHIGLCMLKSFTALSDVSMSKLWFILLIPILIANWMETLMTKKIIVKKNGYAGFMKLWSFNFQKLCIRGAI